MYEREHDRPAPTLDEPNHVEDVAPGRDNRTTHLAAPNQPVVSGLIQRKASGEAGESAEQAVAAASAGSGHALPEMLMRKFESSLGADLGGVRVHNDGASSAAASAVGAKAYTLGQDIHFGAGQYDPTSAGGENLLAHEVAHTVQQRGGSPHRQNKLNVSSPADALEVEADRAADAMVAGKPFATSGFSPGIHRRPQPPDRDPNAVPDLATEGSITRDLGSKFFTGPGGIVLKADLKARLSEKSHTHGEAALSGNIESENGKPEGNVGFKFRGHDFTVHLAPDGKLHAETEIEGDIHDLKWRITCRSHGNSLQVHLDSIAHIPTGHGGSLTLGVGIELDITAIGKKPPKGVRPDPAPLKIPLKVLIPTIEIVGGAITVGAILTAIGEGALALAIG